MLVQFGAKLESGNIVVRPARVRKDTFSGGVIAQIPALRVEYRNHFWKSDSDEAMNMYRRYAEAMTELGQPVTAADARKLVEDFVTTHPWRKRVDGSRINIMDDHGLVIQPSDLEARCMAIKFDEETGDSSVCGKPAEPGSNKCAECLAEIEAETSVSV